MFKMHEQFIGEVLVIEDDKIFSTLHAHTVKQTLGIEPQNFENAQDAIRFLDSAKSCKEKTLILLDLNMPGMNGWQFLDAISQKAYIREILIVIVTSSLFGEDYNRSLDYEQVIGYFTKPLKKEKFYDLVKRKSLVFSQKN